MSITFYKILATSTLNLKMCMNSGENGISSAETHTLYISQYFVSEKQQKIKLAKSYRSISLRTVTYKL